MRRTCWVRTAGGRCQRSEESPRFRFFLPLWQPPRARLLRSCGGDAASNRNSRLVNCRSQKQAMRSFAQKSLNRRGAEKFRDARKENTMAQRVETWWAYPARELESIVKVRVFEVSRCE